ncbi:transcription activator GAGA-like isoform X2 [Macrobrachium rosenbergii]|uniref:transcription activator GAGA-like isoform X2 n=2 Tax=Macrobrachium rosenbergii TaxID=79674 RepID=UPI0034D4E251
MGAVLLAKMKKKRSTVWRHFKEESDNKVSCRTCHKILTNHGNTSIMLRHLRGKHPELVGCLLELDGPTVTGEVTWPVDNQPQQVDEAEAVVDNATGGNKKRSTVWRHFQEEGNDKVSCRICREKLAKHGNTSSMLRHLRGKHPQLKLPSFQGERKSSRFHLKTNMTESRFMAICDRLLRNNQLTDCTLVAEGQCVQAHRLVLASCSESFEEIFSSVTQVNPVIVLRDVSIQELRGLINYMYKGETLVKSNELHGLLKAAAQLKIKGLSQVGLSDSWLESSSSQTNGSGRLHPKEDLSYYHHDDNDLEDMEDEMEHHIVQPATPFNKRHATLDLMSMCEDVDLGGGPATKDGTHAEDRLLKRVQIKVEHGTALVDSEPQHDNQLPQQQEPHTATHYISAGEEVVIHQNSHEIQHTHRGDETIEATVTMAHDPLSTGSDLEAPSITSTPILEDGSQQQPTTSHTTIDEDGLILLGLSGGETHTTIISAGTSPPLHTSETQRPTIARRPRKYTKRDLMTALKLVDEGHLALKPAARAFNIPVTTLYTASKRRDATGGAMKEENK